MASETLNVILFTLLFAIGWFAYTQHEQVSRYAIELYQTNIKLNESESRIFALGENLWTRKHIFDIKFIVNTTTGHYEFYAHKHILAANSEYFDILFSNNKTIDVITYNNISKTEFNALLELLYFGKFKTAIHLQGLSNIMTYMDRFMLINKYANYTDSYFSKLVPTKDDYIYDFPTISSVYEVASQFRMNLTAKSILTNIYNDWKNQGLFNVNHVANHPHLFYDYIRKLNCYPNLIRLN